MKITCTQCSKEFECEGLPVFKVCQPCINLNAAERLAETVKRLATPGVSCNDLFDFYDNQERPFLTTNL